MVRISMKKGPTVEFAEDESQSVNMKGNESKLAEGHQKKERKSMPQIGLFGDITALKEAGHEELHKPDYNVEDFYWESGFFSKVAKSAPFQNITLGVISVNAVWMGYDTDKNDAATVATADLQFQIAEHVFAVYFTGELLTRFFAFENKCNTMKDGWFKFDTVLCTLMVFETWMLPVMSSGDGEGGVPIDTSMLRLLRLLRLSRMLRLLKKCPELITLLKGMASALRSVGSVLILLVLFMYVFAIIFRQQADGNEELAHYFSTVGQCFWTLLLAGTFLDGIGDALTLMKDDSPGLCVIFLLFVLIGNLTILNMLIGVLCEVVSAVGAAEAEKMTVQYAKDAFLHVLEDMDADGSGTISQDEFVDFVNNPTVKPALEDLGVDREALLSLQDVIFEGTDQDARISQMSLDDEEEEENALEFGDILEHILKLRGSNVAVVKDVVELRKFINSCNKKAQECTNATSQQTQEYVTKLSKTNFAQMQKYLMQLELQFEKSMKKSIEKKIRKGLKAASTGSRRRRLKRKTGKSSGKSSPSDYLNSDRHSDLPLGGGKNGDDDNNNKRNLRTSLMADFLPGGERTEEDSSPPPSTGAQQLHNGTLAAFNLKI